MRYIGIQYKGISRQYSGTITRNTSWNQQEALLTSPVSRLQLRLGEGLAGNRELGRELHIRARAALRLVRGVAPGRAEGRQRARLHRLLRPRGPVRDAVDDEVRRDLLRERKPAASARAR